MGFPSGSVSFQRYLVIGEAPSAPDDEVLAKLHDARFQETEYGLPDEVEVGWCSPRHLLDSEFSLENCAYADSLFFGLRVDTNRVPGELKRALSFVEEGGPEEAGKKDKNAGRKRQAKDAARARLEEMLKSGRFRKSKRIPILWDMVGGMVYAPASASIQEKLLDLFDRTFGLQLQVLSSGLLAERLLEGSGKRRDLEDMRPARFVYGPDGQNQWPEYPWVAKQADSAVGHSRDHLGNELLLWLWHAAADGGAVKTDDGEVSVVVTKSIDLQCAYGQSGRDSLKSDNVAQMPEGKEALKSGKVPRKIGLILESGGQFELTLSAESLGVGAAKLPEVEEAETPRVLFEERIALLRQLGKTLDSLLAAFLKVRTGSWDGQVRALRKWITGA